MDQRRDLRLSRRALLASGSGFAVAAVAAPASALSFGPSTVGTLAPVVSLHMDRTYFDPTGEAWAYTPAIGARSADVLGGLSDEQHRWMNPFG